MLVPETTWRFKLDVAGFNGMLESFGSTHPLPQELDGEVFVVNIPAALTADYSGPDAIGEGGYLVVGQTRSPELIVPDGVDPAELRDVILNLPLLPENLRSQLAAIEDWRSTLIIPNVDGQATEVEIAGKSAVVLSDPVDGEDGQQFADSGVIWNDEGVVRAVGGTMTREEALSLAESMIR